MAVTHCGSSREPNDASKCTQVSSIVIEILHYFVLFYSGNVVIETEFFDGDKLLSTSRVRVHYV